MRRYFHVFLAALIAFISTIPAPSVRASAPEIVTANDRPVDFPAVFSPYAFSDGTAIFDPAGDEHPIDADVASGVERGAGLLPSMYVASDGANFFVRLRLKGDPFDRKGGFLSTVWMVQLASEGRHVATVGLNGKPASADYVYVANADGSVVQPVYATEPEAGGAVPGTRIEPAGNGQYFLDFQVPISRIQQVASVDLNASPVQLFFGTSKAANLSVINKEFMDTGANGGGSTDFAGLLSFRLDEQPLSVAIDGGPSKTYSATSNVMSGTSSLAEGLVSISIAGGTPATAEIAGHAWSYALPEDILSSNGLYPAAVSVVSGAEEASASQDLMVVGKSETLTINGGASAETASTAPAVSGTYGSSKNGQNFNINLYVSETGDSKGTTSFSAKGAEGSWTIPSVQLPDPQDGKVYYLTAELVDNGQGKTPYASAKQELVYKEGAAAQPVAVAIETIAGDARPSLTGTSAGAARVELRVDGVSTAFATPGPAGEWSLPELERPLAVGTHALTVVATGTAGGFASAEKAHIVTETAIAIDNGVSVTSNDGRPTVRGDTNAADGETVTVSIGGAGTYTTTAKNGRWTIGVTDGEPALGDGLHPVTASANGAIAEQQLTVDSSARVAIEAPADNSETSERSFAFSGTGDAGDSIRLALTTSGDVPVWIANLNVSEAGTWTYTPADPLELGAYKVWATAADPYGNEAYATHAFAVADPTEPEPSPDPEPSPSPEPPPEPSPSPEPSPEPEPLQIESLADVSATVDNGTSLQAARAKLPAQVTATLSDDSSRTLDVTWSENSEPSYDGTKAGTYCFTGEIAQLPDGVANGNRLAATGNVTVRPPALRSGKDIASYAFAGFEAAANVDAVQHAIQIELPFGTDVSSLIAEFTLSDGATAEIAGVPQASGTTANDFGSEVAYTVIAEDGSTREWTVRVTLAEQDQTAQPVVADPSPIREGDAELAGTAAAGAVVTIARGGETLGSAVADENGRWTVSGLALSAGDELTITAKEADKSASRPLVVSVQAKPAQPSVRIEAFEETALRVFKGTDPETVRQLLGARAQATLENGETVSVPVEWNLSGFDASAAGSRSVAGIVGELPDNVNNENGVQPFAAVTVLEDLEVAGSANGERTVTATGAYPGAVVRLYGSEGSLIQSASADSQGKVVFANVQPGSGYYVNQALDSLESRNSPKVNVLVPSSAPGISGSMDGLRTVTVTGADPGAAVKLYDKNGNAVRIATADANGKAAFESVPFGTGYEAAQIVDGVESARSSEAAVLPKIRLRFSDGEIWESVTKSVFLMDNLMGTGIRWSSSQPDVLAIADNPVHAEGSDAPEYVVTVNRQDEDRSVILTASLTFEGKPVERTFLLVVKGRHFDPAKATEDSSNEVRLGDRPLTEGVQVKRTTLNESGNPTQRVDKLIVTEQANLGAGDVSIRFDDTASGIRADEQAVEVSLEALRKLTGTLTVAMPEATVSIPYASVERLTDSGLDLFFRVVPMRADDRIQDVIDRTAEEMQAAAGDGKRVQVLDIPREIETNYSNIDTDIILPLTGLNLTPEQAENVRLYIEHTTGPDEIIVPGANGEIVSENGRPVGLKFRIDHFSTFTFFAVSDQAPAPVSFDPGITPTGIRFDEPASGEYAAGSPIAIGGTVEGPAGSRTLPSFDVTVYIDGQAVATVKTDASGKWAYDIGAGLTVGEHEVRAVIQAGGRDIRSDAVVITVAATEEGSHFKYIYGYEDGLFHPEAAVTRAQMAAMLARNLSGGSVPASSGDSYPDVSGLWAKNEIEYVREQNIILGYADGTFGPQDGITRAQMAAIAVRWIDRQCRADSGSAYCAGAAADIAYADVKPGHWAAGDIARVGATGLMSGDENGAFRPNDLLTRAEAVTVLNRLFGRGPLEGVAAPTFADVPASYWAYKDVEEASTDHAYALEDGKEYRRE